MPKQIKVDLTLTGPEVGDDTVYAGEGTFSRYADMEKGK